jgi:cytochrome c biogenesis protein CcmG, thiol:disulfide interchange protein DsbE
MNSKVVIAGVVIGSALIAVLAVGLGKNPSEIRTPLIGKPAPSFALRDVVTGRTIDLASLRGKPVVLNFWATWCRPCWFEHPVLVENAMKRSDVQFLGVVFQDTEQNILGFLRERGSSYPTVVDDRGKTAIAYGVGGVPETYFLDANGVIAAKFTGPLTEKDLDDYLKKVPAR